VDPNDRIRELEEQKDALGRRVARAEADFDEKVAEAVKVEVDKYKDENTRYAEALQTIADGRGKYAKVARDAL
jgi:hypothetical protein